MESRKIDILSVFLKEKRALAGLSQWEVAKRLGYSSPQFVSNWERGLSDPPIVTLKKLATIYQVPINEMYDVTLEAAIKRVKEDMRKKFEGRKK